MAGSATSAALSDEICQLLTTYGSELLRRPNDLLTLLRDRVPAGDPAMCTLAQNCSAELFAPFLGIARGDTPPNGASLARATREAEAFLTQERYLDAESAHLLCSQVAQGVAQYANQSRRGTKPTPIHAISDLLQRLKAAPRLRWALPAVAAALVLTALLVTAQRTTITFSHGGSGTGSMDSISVWKDTATRLPRCSFRRDGYRFLFWEVGSKRYKDGGMISVSGATTLIARWAAVVSFDPNGASGGGFDRAADEDGYLSLPDCPFYSYDHEYEFAGWALRQCDWGDNPKTHEPGEGIVVEGPTTCYAVWAPLASFDANGASGSMDQMRISPSGRVTLPKNEFRRSGWRFIGWSKSPDGKLAGPGTTVTANGPTTFYAVWRPLASFDRNGGSGSMDDVAAKKGGALTLPKNGFSRTDYRFLGWATSRSGTPKSPGETVTISGPTTFYARWGAKVSFDANGGTGYTADVYADEDDEFTFPSCGFTYADHVFDGWATSSSGSGLYDPGETRTVNSPKTYYATWKLDPKITSKISKEYICLKNTTMYKIKNNSSTTLKLTGTFTYKDDSDTEIETKTDELYAVAPGELAILSRRCSSDDWATVTFHISAEEVLTGRTSLYGKVRVEELSVIPGRISLRLHNYSDKTARVVSLLHYSYGANGGWAYWPESAPTFPVFLDPGESYDVTLKDDSSNPIEWDQFTREYYLDGYIDD